jgi:hypothetical protein
VTGLRLFFRIVFSPVPSGSAFYGMNFRAFRSVFMITFPDEVSFSFSVISLRISLQIQLFRVLSLPVVQYDFFPVETGFVCCLITQSLKELLVFLSIIE